MLDPYIYMESNVKILDNNYILIAVLIITLFSFNSLGFRFKKTIP